MTAPTPDGERRAPGWIGRLRRFAASPVVRWTFIVIAVVLIGVAVATQWEAVVDAVKRMTVWSLVLALLAGLGFVALTMLAWRLLLAAVGFRLPIRPAFAVYAVSQLGKYIPGGVWNIAAAAELGAGHRVPRRLVVSASLIATVVTVVSGFAVGALTFALSPEVARTWWWTALFAIPLAATLFPPLLNRVIALAFRVTGREPLARGVSSGGLAGATALTVAAWIAAGAQLWIILVSMGMAATVMTALLCIGAAALGWAAGFIVVFAPAGVGVREVIVAVALSGVVDQGTAIAAVVLSRVLLIAADAIAAGGGAPLLRAGQGASPEGKA